MSAFGLAPLAPAERAHEARVIAAIAAECAAAGGWLPFARYMELALYAPGLGYYAAGAHKLGAGGDFVTAPEVSPVFGRCLATQCAQVLGALGGGEILELGAGSGALALDMLEELARAGTLPTAYRILEPSPDLRQRQRERLAPLPPELRGRITWLDAVPATPFAGVVLANEVLDALPVERFRIGAHGVEALGVACTDERFAWAPRPASAALAGAIADLEAALGASLAPGYVSELCPSLAPWLAAITAPLRVGVALLLDYGTERRNYYAPERSTGTLACYHRQRRHDDPFVNVGLQDLSAWVDFSAVAEAGLAAGLDLAGYTSQSQFLLALGFERQVSAVRDAAAAAPAPLVARAAARLVLPSEMGESFRCLALARGWSAPLTGFAWRDFSAAL